MTQVTSQSDSEITLGLLRAIDEDASLTQRGAARELGIALGLANTYFKRCIKKGLIKAQQIPANRYAYYLTPQGFMEKSRLTAEFLSQSLSLFRQAQTGYGELLETCSSKQYNRIALIGASDLAQIFPNIVEDVTSPTITNLEVKQESGGQTAEATWTPSDDQTPAASLNYFYAIDKPAEEWDDPDMTFLGKLATPEATLDISQLAEGEHTFDLVVLDAEGNIGATSVSFDVDGNGVYA